MEAYLISIPDKISSPTCSYQKNQFMIFCRLWRQVQDQARTNLPRQEYSQGQGWKLGNIDCFA